MLISVIFPLTDLRPFRTGLGGRLSRPNWTLPDTRDFVRSIGPVRERMLGGGDAFLREGYYCEASRDLRGAIGIGGAGKKRLKGLVGSYKRLYFDGFRLEIGEGQELPQPAVGEPDFDDSRALGGAVTGKLEIGLIYGAGAARRSGATSLGSILHDALSTELKPHRRSDASAPLALIGEPFARFLQQRTTHKADLLPNEMAPSLVLSGEALAIVHLRKSERFELPAEAQRVDLPADSRHEIHHLRIRTGGRDIRAWILLDKSSQDLKQGRLLRLYLARLHLEHQSLRAILRAMGTPGLIQTDKASRDRLQVYLRGALRRVSAMGKLSSDIAGHEMGAIARYSEDLIRPGDEAALLDALKALALRPNIARSASEYIRKDAKLFINVESGGILNMNNTTNVNNNSGTQGTVQQGGAGASQIAQTEQAGEPKSIPEALERLGPLVEQLKAELPPADAAQAAKSLGHLKTELDTPGAEPDKGVVSGALDRLGAFADKAGKYVEPIGKIVGLIRKLGGF